MLERYKSFDIFMEENYQHVDFAADIRQWSETTRDSITKALKAAGIQVNDMDYEEGIMQQMYDNIENAEDRQATLDVANDIAHFNSKQLQSLRQLIATQMQITGSYYEQKNAIETAQQARMLEFMQPTLGDFPIIGVTIGNDPTFPNLGNANLP